jgi:hypothetical protein
MMWQNGKDIGAYMSQITFEKNGQAHDFCEPVLPHHNEM